MCEPSAVPKEEVSKEILSYFLRAPNVVDTFTGIARWRLLEEVVDRNVATTDLALDWLIKQGFLIEETIVGSPNVFRLNPEKRSEAERLVKSGRDFWTDVDAT